MGEIIKAYKGFDKDLKCRGFQYKVGGEYDEPKAYICDCGFHACESPLDVFGYYPPGQQSRYCVVELDANNQTDDDSKRVGKHIKIGAEIGIAGLVKAHFEYVNAHVKKSIKKGDSEAATAGYKGAATAGDSGAATAGDSGAATAGDYGAATAGDSGAATAGYKGAATAGNYGAATSRGKSATGVNGLSVARGNNAKVKGGVGAVLVIVEENETSYNIKEWKAAVVDGEKIKPDTWYMLKNGEFVEVDE